LITRINEAMAEKRKEQQLLSTIIPKHMLIDGQWYVGVGDNTSRKVDKAWWNEKYQVFYYKEYSHGHAHDSTMKHLVDVIDTNEAGFTPIKVIEYGEQE